MEICGPFSLNTLAHHPASPESVLPCIQLMFPESLHMRVTVLRVHDKNDTDQVPAHQHPVHWV